MELRPGARLKSTVCETEVVAVKVDVALAVTCGGAPMVEASDEVTGAGTPAAELSGGTQIGKRYTDDEGVLELLCVKPGAGTLSANGKPLIIKGSKPLPASD
jgi:hypothetical protein